MGKAVATEVYDAALNNVKNNANKMVVCSAQPTTFAEANATYMLANVAMASGDFTVGAGDVSGRKVQIAAKSGVTVTNSGTATHVAVIDTTNSLLKLVTTCTSQALTAGNTVNIPTWKDEIQAPT